MSNLGSLKLAIGIPTLNRVFDLKITLESILKNTILPDKIIIADQSDDDNTYKLIKDYQNNSNADFVYLRIDKKGLTHARNVILENLNDIDIVTFLDDDVTLDKSYIEHIKNTFEKDKKVSGVQGFIIQDKIKVLKEFLKLNFNKIFGKPRVYEDFKNTYPLIVKKGQIIESEWLSGCNMSYRVKDIKGEKFEEQFILYALGEDLEFSHRLYLKGKRLLMNTSALLVHRVSNTGRLPSRAKITMNFGYRRYMIAKYREKNRIDEIFESYINFLKSQLRFLKYNSPKKFYDISKIIDESLEIVKLYKNSCKEK